MAEYENIKEPEEKQVETSKEATQLPDNLTVDNIGEYKSEQLVEFFDNAKKFRTSATQKSMDVADREKAVKAQEDVNARQQYEFQQRQEKFYSDLQQQNLNPPTAQPQHRAEPTSPPDFDNDPAGAYRALFDEQKRATDKIEELKQQYDNKYNELSNTFSTGLNKVSYNQFFTTEIKPKYPDVRTEDLDRWINDHPWIQSPDSKVVFGAAKEIQDGFNSRVDARAKAIINLEQKESLARQATESSSANVGALQPVEDFIDKSDDEQIDIAVKMAKELQKKTQ